MKTQSLLGPGGRASFASVTIDQGGTLDIYNTADKTTNYERLRVSWAANRAELGTFFAGTGAPRQLRVGAGTTGNVTSYLGFYSQQFPFLEITLPNTASPGVLSELFKGSFTGSAGTQTIASIQPTINQSGTAGATILNIDPTVTATGSGTYKVQRWGWNGSELTFVNSAGTLISTNLGCGSTGVIGFSSSGLGVGLDVLLYRDATNALALRNGASAQTFRQYRSYTDGSNYSRVASYFSSTTFILATEGAGTGARGNIAFGAAALATGATVGYVMIPSCAGAPTGVPADIPTGQVALHYDTTNNKIYVYNGAWRSTAALT